MSDTGGLDMSFDHVRGQASSVQWWHSPRDGKWHWRASCNGNAEHGVCDSEHVAQLTARGAQSRLRRPTDV